MSIRASRTQENKGADTLSAILSPQEVDALRRILGVYFHERDWLAGDIASLRAELAKPGVAATGASNKGLDEIKRKLQLLEATDANLLSVLKEKNGALSKSLKSTDTEVKRLNNRLMVLQQRLSAIESRTGPSGGDLVDEDDDDTALEEFYNECLANKSRTRRFRVKYMPRTVGVERRDGAVVFVESKGANLMLVQHGDSWCVAPEFEVAYYDSADLKACFDLSVEPTDEEDAGYVVRLERAATCTVTAEGCLLGQKGALVVSRGL
jgi:hypothetical protein